MKLCPRCRQRVVTARGNTDVIHECNSGDSTLDQEDVQKIGNWTDYDGEGVIPKHQVMLQGINNELRGTDAALMGADEEEVTLRGNSKDLWRTRQHFEFVEFK